MDRITDQTILGILCLLLLPLTVVSGVHVVALLAAVVITCCFELSLPVWTRGIVVGGYLLACIVFPQFTLFLPVAAYGLASEALWLVRAVWLVPLIASLRMGDYLLCAASFVLCSAACLMSWRARRMETERAHYRHLRDEQQEEALFLAQKNHDLLAAQDYEVRLATLSERSRIAREIHDNVGHLLTRSLLQVEAMQVVHAADGRVKEELVAVGQTLHEAMDTVRASVHDLHDDAFDMRSQLESTIQACGVTGVRLTFDASDVPAPVAYGMVAMVREALSNVAKHSDATRVEVSVIEYPALYQLVVQDNGSRRRRENDTTAIPSGTHGIGLQTMEERINALGGRLRVEYQKGFRVFATIPKQTDDTTQRQEGTA